jgi:HD-GYP domain-containing protein (c-di-GMP phosphodiesterase class II)
MRDDRKDGAVEVMGESVAETMAGIQRRPWRFVGLVAVVLMVMAVVAIYGKVGDSLGAKDRESPSLAELQLQVDRMTESVARLNETVVPKMEALKEENDSLKAQVERDAVVKREIEGLLEELGRLDPETDREAYAAKMEEIQRALQAKKEWIKRERERVDRSFANALDLSEEQLEELLKEQESQRKRMPESGEMPEE